MEQNRQTNYFRIGSFVVIGIALLIAAFIVFGSGIFQRTFYVETYFSESVQGLAVGSPVKYLGMEIGNVKEIATVDNVYPAEATPGNGTHDRYIYVKMSISDKFLVSMSSDVTAAEIKKDVAAGLRIKLAMQGLTGNAYLELDFMNPKTHPPLKISWKPKYYYVPSTTSTLTYFSDNVQYILEELKGINLKKLFEDIQILINNANIIASRGVTSVNNLRNITANLTVVSERAKAFPSSILFGKAPPKLDPSRL